MESTESRQSLSNLKGQSVVRWLWKLTTGLERNLKEMLGPSTLCTLIDSMQDTVIASKYRSWNQYRSNHSPRNSPEAYPVGKPTFLWQSIVLSCSKIQIELNHGVFTQSMDMLLNREREACYNTPHGPRPTTLFYLRSFQMRSTRIHIYFRCTVLSIPDIQCPDWVLLP